MQIINKKGAVLLDVMIAIIFFAIVSMGIFKLLFSDKTSVEGSVTTVEQLDLSALKIEFQNQFIEWAKININCSSTPCTLATTYPTPPTGITLSGVSVDDAASTITFSLTANGKTDTIKFYYGKKN